MLFNRSTVGAVNVGSVVEVVEVVDVVVDAVVLVDGNVGSVPGPVGGTVQAATTAISPATRTSSTDGDAQVPSHSFPAPTF